MLLQVNGDQLSWRLISGVRFFNESEQYCPVSDSRKWHCFAEGFLFVPARWEAM